MTGSGKGSDAQGDCPVMPPGCRAGDGVLSLTKRSARRNVPKIFGRWITGNSKDLPNPDALAG